MKTNTSTLSKPMASGLSAAIAICAGAALLINVSSAFAQVDPNVKTGVAGNVQTGIPPGFTTEKAGEIRANGIPPGIKCGHSSPGFKTDKAAETRALLPAVKAADQTKKADTQKADALACANK